MGLNSHDANRQVQITYLNSVVMPDGDSSGSSGSDDDSDGGQEEEESSGEEAGVGDD
jgi:hypothetical protein